jgi:sterol desaturase/sphingolipid hydroxylase (fatty acid hydroxylase superfamily)
METTNYFAWIFIPLGLLFVLEIYSDEFVKRVLKTPQRRARALWYFASNAIVALGLREFNDATRQFLPDLLDWHAPVVAGAISCILAAEFFNYWFHRLGHGILWRFHFVHHRDEVYSMALGTQAHVVEILLRGIILSALLSLLGFSMLSVDVYMIFFVVGAAYQHSNRDYSLGPVDYFMVTPRAHRYHHAKDKHINFGATIILWDLMFGTYQWPNAVEARQLPIGIRDTGEPYGFWQELIHPFRRMRPPRQCDAHEHHTSIPSS